VAVLGAMRELGREAEEAHLRLARRAAAAALDLVFLFGEELEAAARALDGTDRVRWFGDAEALGEAVAGSLREGDLVLVKGSRGVALERIVPRITPLPARGSREERKAACS
jgi:UDP-N-acetylmuramoyl-tripeptide--D-alanyl-D-alanine ligase